MKLSDLKRVVKEESDSMVIDLEQKRKEREQKRQIKQIILDSIESHAISLITGIPQEQASQIRFGMSKEGNQYLVRLLNYMYDMSSKKGSKYRMLQHLRDMHSEERWPDYKEQLEAFAVGVQSALDDYYGEPEPHLRVVPDEEELSSN
tara:strand:+ start:1150 stop:1593 length:444 start_codon:yes stop_codon:yes gene_type:complete